MNKMFFALIALLPFIAGCWPFSKKEKKQEMTEIVVPATEETTVPTTEETASTDEETHSEDETEK